MPKNTMPGLVVTMAVSFTSLGGVVIFLLVMRIVPGPVGILMLVALVGLHLGFGILIAVYRLMSRLE